ncbi:MAG: DUF305 domain-containing protein [Candidatus Eisenbacteria bacterium]
MPNSRVYFLSMVLLALTACGAERQGADFDLRFIDNMTTHHQSAIDMARAAEATLTHPETKEFARQIIADQTKEIDQMKAWRDAWYEGAPSAKSDKIPGMDMQHEMGGGDSDISFIEMMIPHHQGAIEMAKAALQQAKRPEIKQLAQSIIMAQDAEIQRMNGWKAAWQK